MAFQYSNFIAKRAAVLNCGPTLSGCYLFYSATLANVIADLVKEAYLGVFGKDAESFLREIFDHL